MTEREPVQVRIGGLLRCCTATLGELWEAGELKTEEGTSVTCKYCKRPTMVYRDGAYEWVGRDDRGEG
jgi:hypothetical protein